MEPNIKKPKGKLTIGEIAEILDLFGNGDDGASKGELARLFKTTRGTITRVLENYSDDWKKNKLADYLVEN